MRIKLDENLGKPCAALFQSAGHDAETVAAEGLSGASDWELIRRCRDEARAIVTLDLDFASPLRFRPSEYRGIAVLRLSGPASTQVLEDLCRTLIAGLARDDLAGKLWIVELGRIRVYQEDEPD